MLVNESYVKGLKYKVYLDGTVNDLKTNGELGYMNEDDVRDLIFGNYERFLVDRLVEEKLVLPAFVETQTKRYFDSKKSNIKEKKYCPRKACPITFADIDEYRTAISKMWYEVLYSLLVERTAAKTISQKMGITKEYVYYIKCQTVNKIIDLKKKSKIDC